MSCIDNGGQLDPYVERLKSAKNVRAVAKVCFATFASSITEKTNIFAYEGSADKLVFYYWINGIRRGLKYEPYVVKNKNAVLQLFDALKNDETGLGDKVYFFVDRDFDQLQGRAEDEKIFMTKAYSIENYFVCKELLEDILNIEFHCNGYPAVRNDIINLFNDLYAKFLKITEHINLRIFVARKLGIHQIEDLPKNIKHLANIELQSVKPSDSKLHEIVRLQREPTEKEIIECLPEFSKLNQKHNYRGKFALLFFLSWLNQLRTDRLTNSSTCFNNIPMPEFTVKGDFSLETLAPKVPAPEELSDFLARIGVDV